MCNLSGNTRPQSSQLVVPLWTDPSLKDGISIGELRTDPSLKGGISVSELISILKKKKKIQAGMNG